jgi:hypothetical protein
MLKRSIIIISAIGLTLGSLPIASGQSAQTQQRLLGQTAFKQQKGSTKVESAAEAAQLTVGTTLLFRCARCGGSQSVAVDEGKTQMAWFSGNAKICPWLCGGWVRYESVRSPAGGVHPYTRNTCSRCRKPTTSWTVVKSTHS